MPSLLPRRRLQPRRFAYEPRFYDPAHDERLARRLRAGRARARSKTKQPRFVAVALGLVVVLYLYLNAEALAERAARLGGVLFGG